MCVSAWRGVCFRVTGTGAGCSLIRITEEGVGADFAVCLSGGRSGRCRCQILINFG